jgi:hypothetical protein
MNTTIWKCGGAVLCLGVGLFAARMLWAQEGGFGPQSTPLSVSVQQALSEQNEDAKHTAWISTVMKRLQTIKPGQTRADLLKICTTEGGFYSTMHHPYVYRGCPYIKVMVRFRSAAKTGETQSQQPTDTITEISKPYLEWTILD